MPPISDFIQTEPQEGAPATEKTEVWVFFDDDNVYVSLRCWESQPERLVANEMRRDSPDIVAERQRRASSFDTFYDRRNAVIFDDQPDRRPHGRPGHQRAQYNGDWNPVWDVEVGRFDGGWTVEAAIPFKSLRYRPGHAQVWGFNARRTQPVEERDLVPHADPAGAGPAATLPGVARGDAGRARGAAAVAATSRSSRTRSSSLTTDRNATPRRLATTSAATSGST